MLLFLWVYLVTLYLKTPMDMYCEEFERICLQEKYAVCSVLSSEPFSLSSYEEIKRGGGEICWKACSTEKEHESMEPP